MVDPAIRGGGHAGDAQWRRDDSEPFDPWIRLHVRLGGRIVRASPRSMTMRGTVAEWEAWTGLALPETGEYVLDGATSPLLVDRERDAGVYHDQNVWIVHELGSSSPPGTDAAAP